MAKARKVARRVLEISVQRLERAKKRSAATKHQEGEPKDEEKARLPQMPRTKYVYSSYILVE